MVIVMWLVNLFSLFSCFGALVVLVFLALKTKDRKFGKLFIIIFIYVFSYASGILYLIVNFGFTIPEIQSMDIIPRDPGPSYFIGSLLYIVQLFLIINTLEEFLKTSLKKIYFIFGPLLLISFLIPDLLLFIDRNTVERFSIFFIVNRLVFGYITMEFAVLAVLIKRKLIPEKMRKGFIIVSWIFAIFVIPSMFIEDMLTLYRGMLAYNFFEALGFLSLMTMILVSGIYYLSIYARKTFDSVSLLDVSEKYGLTEREMDVLKELVAASSASYKEIASRLNISHETVKTHVSRIYRKLGVSAKQELKYKIRDLS